MVKNMIRLMIVLGTVASATLLTRHALRKYLPVTLFSTIIQLSEIFYYAIYKKWQVKGKPGALICDALILVTGPYFMATLLSFQYAKGKFIRYFLINVLLGFVYAFPILQMLKSLKIFKLRLTSIRIFFLTVLNSILNYWYFNAT